MDSKQSQTGVYIHSGVVSRIDQHSVSVVLDREVACEDCRAKALCGVAEATVKEVEVALPSTPLHLNQQVHVLLKKGLGWQAVFWAYIFPFLLMATTLVAGSLVFDEWLAGVLSVGVLIPYFAGVYSLRGYFKRTFRVSLVTNA